MSSFKPQFPFKGNQIILSSDRVMLHSKSDAIFLFGKEAVSLSSTKTINLDASEAILLDTPIIELGSRARDLGQPIILGFSFNRQLVILVKKIANAGLLLSQVSESDLGGSMQAISSAGQILYKEGTRMSNLLNTPNSPILSKTTYTR
jgi:hypothetical protein